MIKIIQMTLDEFVTLTRKDDWLNLQVGTIYVDKNDDGKWIAVEIIQLNPTELKKYPLQII